MTVALVHGVPETDAVWGPLVDALRRDDVVTLSPPGFGAPLPDGFRATRLEYRDWLEAELARIGGQIDLVGHDWGGLHVVHVAMHRPDLLRSWASDVVGMFDADYVWHDIAQVWQTTGGEEIVNLMMGDASTVESRAGLLTELDIPLDIATSIAAEQGPQMGKAILALYRSAAQPALADAGGNLENAASRPGLSIVATEDPYVGTAEMKHRAAQRAGARTEVLDGLGHWWMVQDPARGAQILTDFWESIE